MIAQHKSWHGYSWNFLKYISFPASHNYNINSHLKILWERVCLYIGKWVIFIVWGVWTLWALGFQIQCFSFVFSVHLFEATFMRLRASHNTAFSCFNLALDWCEAGMVDLGILREIVWMKYMKGFGCWWLGDENEFIVWTRGQVRYVFWLFKYLSW